MHVDQLYALALSRQHEAEERARTYHVAKQARAARHASASAPHRRQRRRMRRLRPVGEST